MLYKNTKMETFINLIPIELYQQILQYLDIKDLLLISHVRKIKYKHLMLLTHPIIYNIFTKVRNFDFNFEYLSYKTLYYEIIKFEYLNKKKLNIESPSTYIDNKFNDIYYAYKTIQEAPEVYKFLIDKNLILGYLTYQNIYLAFNSKFTEKYKEFLKLPIGDYSDLWNYNIDTLDRYYIFINLCVQFILIINPYVINKVKIPVQLINVYEHLENYGEETMQVISDEYEHLDIEYDEIKYDAKISTYIKKIINYSL